MVPGVAEPKNNLQCEYRHSAREHTGQLKKEGNAYGY